MGRWAPGRPLACFRRNTNSNMASRIRSRSRAIPKTVAHGLGIGRSAWLLPLDLTFKAIGLRYHWLKAFFDHAPPEALGLLGRRRAERAA